MNDMDVPGTLVAWGQSLGAKIDLGELLSRNPLAHKWKATFRSLVLRETLLWRAHDLLSQSLLLHEAGHELGARVLLRSAFETTAVLIYLNQITGKVVAEKLDFHEFSRKTQQLLAGSKDGSTEIENINVVGILRDHADKKYTGIWPLYQILSESAHPSFEGMMRGYTLIDHEEHIATFSNLWAERYAGGHLQMMSTCMITLEHEYNTCWNEQFEALEEWLVANDEHLEATKEPLPVDAAIPQSPPAS